METALFHRLLQQNLDPTYGSGETVHFRDVTEARLGKTLEEMQEVAASLTVWCSDPSVSPVWMMEFHFLNHRQPIRRAASLHQCGKLWQRLDFSGSPVA